MQPDPSTTDLPPDLLRTVAAACCPHTDCAHQDTYRCSGWAGAVDALEGVPDRWVKLDGAWLQLPETVTMPAGLAAYLGLSR